MFEDVVIAGGGPAGSFAALILAQAGVRVRICDRAVFPRDKLCGDTLNPGALAVLARHLHTSVVLAASIPIDGMVLTGPGDVSVHGRYGDGVHGRAITRRALDQWLITTASAAGAIVEERTRVIGPLVTDDEVRGVRVRGKAGGEQSRPARVTIAAEGRRSPLASALGLARQPSTPRRWAIGAYFASVDGVGTAGEMHVRSGHYVGVAPTAGGLANVCYVSSRAAGADWRAPASLLESTVRSDAQLRWRFARAVRASAVTVLGPMAVDVEMPGRPGLLLAGDAAGFIDPMTGDGLRLALEGAELAADVTLDVLAGRISRTRMARELGDRRRARFRAKWRFNRAMRRLVDYPAGVAGAALAARWLPGLFAQMIRYAGDCETSAKCREPVNQ
ncbi:MAG: NAD(P)/FAD-dependent oxidoreductase [Vicinamibacterales bacterium]